MLHNDDEKYVDTNEPEYHFSDDEEQESHESLEGDLHAEAAPAATMQGPKKVIPTRRIALSIVVFLVLFFAVYKMVAPTMQATPATEIVNTSQQPMTNNNPPLRSLEKASSASVVQTVAQITPPVVAPPQQPVQTVAPAPVATSTPAVQAIGQLPVQSVQSMQALPPTQSQIVTVQQPNMPAQNERMQTTSPTPVTATEANRMSMQAESLRLQNQINAEYTQKLNDYAEQNKMLQEQIETLNARMATMETEFNRLTDTAIKQHERETGQPTSIPPPLVDQQSLNQQTSSAISVVAPKAFYSVQAIIPGRAWLKSDNGDILTVAEGDSIKDFGRVTKIDPYDGIVEVNTGDKVISLSYGATG